ncbi:hypothetical protein V7124_19665 [Neobacillus niacini]|uniref:hypothetical protein n=1 Tax=Neobacillus niacini TaxID=86668 RepID=UPI002FFD84C2
MSHVAIHMPIRVTAEPIAEEQWEQVMGKINRQTLEPLRQEDVFTFSGICSNDRLDAYYTKMDPETTLKNYVRDLQRGVPLQEGHDIYKSPYGRSYDGEMQNDEFNSVRGHWYLLRNTMVNGVNTDDEIRLIRAGIKKSMSVGFGESEGERLSYRCSSCERDIFDWECPHIPGLADEQDRMTFSWIVNGTLREVSTVYTGATPGAYIDKARAYVQQGQMSRENILLLERKYQVRLLDEDKRSIFMPSKGGKNMDLLTQIREALKENKLEKSKIYEVLQSEGDPFRQPEDIAIRNELGEQANVEGIKKLKSEAEMGRTYITDLIDEAVKSRVKVQGEHFNAEQYKQMLIRTNDLEFIKGEIESYDKQALERFTPGRQTQDDDLGADDMQKERAPKVDPQNENIFD